MAIVLYTDGIPYAETAVVANHAMCEVMRKDFATIVTEDRDIIARANFRCIRV